MTNEEMMLKAQLYDLYMSAREEMLSRGFHEIDGMFFSSELAKEYQALKVRLSVLVENDKVDVSQVVSSSDESDYGSQYDYRGAHHLSRESESRDFDRVPNEPIQTDSLSSDVSIEPTNPTLSDGGIRDEGMDSITPEVPVAQPTEPDLSLSPSEYAKKYSETRGFLSGNVVGWAIATRQQISQISSIDFKGKVKSAVDALVTKWKNITSSIGERRDHVVNSVQEYGRKITEGVHEKVSQGKQMIEETANKALFQQQSISDGIRTKFGLMDTEIYFDELQNAVLSLASKEDLEKEGSDRYVQRMVAGGPGSAVKWAFNDIRMGQTREKAYEILVPDREHPPLDEEFVKLTMRDGNKKISTYALVSKDVCDRALDMRNEQQLSEDSRRR